MCRVREGTFIPEDMHIGCLLHWKGKRVSATQVRACMMAFTYSAFSSRLVECLNTPYKFPKVDSRTTEPRGLQIDKHL